MLIIKQWPLTTSIKYKSSFALACVWNFHFHQEVSTANLHPFPSAAHGVGKDDEEDQGDSWGHRQGDQEVSEIVSTFQWLRRGVVLANVWQHTYARVWTVTAHWNNLSDVHLQEQRQTGLSIKKHFTLLQNEYIMCKFMYKCVSPKNQKKIRKNYFEVHYRLYVKFGVGRIF